MTRNGFSFIEVIVVCAIIGILAVAGMTRFYNIKRDAKIAAMEKVVGAVRGSLSIYRANDMATNASDGVYPDVLDANPVGATCSTCFSNILSGGLYDPAWTKRSDDTYFYDDGDSFHSYRYDPASGSFNRANP